MRFENQNTFAKHICVLPKHICVFPKHFCVFNLLGLFIRIGEKLSQGYIQKSFLGIGNYKKIWNLANFFLLRPQLPPLPTPNPVSS